MNLIIPDSSPALFWAKIIHEAEADCMVNLHHELEAYLATLLVRFTNQPQFIKELMAIEFLQSLKLRRQERILALQGVGDKCLLFTGLFPQLAQKRLVKISYFVGIGQSAYDAASRRKSDVFKQLALHFVPLMDVLQSVRIPAQELLPLEAYELWQDTGSQRAFRALNRHLGSTKIGR